MEIRIFDIQKTCAYKTDEDVYHFCISLFRGDVKND